MNNLPGQTTPGRTQPDLRTLDAPQPGLNAPKSGRRETVSAADVALDATGVTTIGTVDADRVTVSTVALASDPGDVVYDIRVLDAVGVGAATVEIEVTDPSETGGATSDVTVDAIGERDL